MSNLPAIRIGEHIRRVYPGNDRYLVGVSGGRDSVTLLHLLQSCGYKNLIVCHLDHQLRKRASQADARFVQSLAEHLDFDAEIGSTDVRAMAARLRLSIETAARVSRFAFFTTVARRQRCQTIFLGHHADDLVETALLNLFRGASPGGLAAMRPISVHHIGKTKLTIVRPLLQVWRREIDRYVKQNGLRFREDASNAKLDSRRNRIRHRILPYVEKQLGRDVRKTIWRAAQVWMEEEALLESLVSSEIGVSALDVDLLREMPVALQRRVIHGWLRLKQIPNIGFDLVENIRSLIQPSASISKINLPGDRHARRRGKKIFVED